MINFNQLITVNNLNGSKYMSQTVECIVAWVASQLKCYVTNQYFMLIMGQGRDDYILVMLQITGLSGCHNMLGDKPFGGGLHSPGAFLVYQC